MRAESLLREGREGSLWHGFKEPKHFLTALQKNAIEGHTTQRWWPDKHRRDDEPGYQDSYWMKGISMTRNPTYAATWGDIILEFDQRAISQTHKIMPISWGATLGGLGTKDRRREAEEFVATYMKPDDYYDYLEDFEDDEEPYREFNFQRWMSPEGRPLQPLDKYLKGVYISSYFKDKAEDMIQDFKEREAEPKGPAKETIDSYYAAVNHPKFKGVIKSGRRPYKRWKPKTNESQLNEYKKFYGLNGWMNPSRVEMLRIIEQEEDLRGTIDTEGNVYFWPAEYEIHHTMRNRLSSLHPGIEFVDDLYVTLDPEAPSDDSWGYDLHDFDGFAIGDYYGILDKHPKMIERLRPLESVDDTKSLSEDIGDDLSWAVGPNQNLAKFGYVQKSEDNAIVWANIEDVFKWTERGQRMDVTDPTGGANKIGDRVKRAIQHWKEGGFMDPAEIYVQEGLRNPITISFQDGRHRLVAAYQLGDEYAPFVVNKDGLDLLKQNVRVTKVIKEQKLTEAVTVKPLVDDLRSRIIKKLKPFVKGNRSYVPGQTTGKLRSTLSDIVSRSIHYVAKKHYGMEKDYDLDVKVRFTKQDEDEGAWVKYIYEEEAIIVTVKINKSDVEKALVDPNVLARLAAHIAIMVAHETVHVYQRMMSKEKMARRSGEMGKFVEPGKTYAERGTSRWWELYLADRQEIEAHASEAVVNLLYQHGLDDPYKAYQHWLTKKPPLGVVAVDKYWHYFGQHKDDVRRQRVWRKFRKKMYEHFMQYIEKAEEKEQNQT